MMDLSTPWRSSADHVKILLFSHKKRMWFFSASPSSSEEMITCLSELPLNDGTFLVSSAGFALLGYSCLSSGSLPFPCLGCAHFSA